MHVKFDSNPHVVHNLYVWNFAYRAARIGIWMEAARDRDRFRRRIYELSKVIDPILIKSINKYRNL